MKHDPLETFYLKLSCCFFSLENIHRDFCLSFLLFLDILVQLKYGRMTYEVMDFLIINVTELNIFSYI